MENRLVEKIESKYTISAKLNVREAMKKLDESHRKILFILNEDKSLLGTLTDGDIRRAIIGNAK